jgi:hypothetical protein
VRQVVGRYRDANAIAGQHADVMASHSAGELCADYGPALVDFDRVLAATQRILDDAFHFEQITLAHVYEGLR